MDENRTGEGDGDYRQKWRQKMWMKMETMDGNEAGNGGCERKRRLWMKTQIETVDKKRSW